MRCSFVRTSEVVIPETAIPTTSRPPQPALRPGATESVSPTSTFPVEISQTHGSALAETTRRRIAGWEVVASNTDHREALVSDLDARANPMLARKSTVDLLEQLRDEGFAWRDVARVVGVSVTAVQKWRRGERAQPLNRRTIAKIVAVVDMLRERGIDDPAAWLEMPIKDQVSVTCIDLLAADRFDLAMEFSVNTATMSWTPDEILDEFDPRWRTTQMDDAFETFVAKDGIRSIRPRSAT